jgi:hypothetical protein
MKIVEKGSKFGNLLVIDFISKIHYEPSGKARKLVLVECLDCGNQFETQLLYLHRSGQKCSVCRFQQNCVVLAGEKYDKLTVINFNTKNGRKLAICECDCGNIIAMRPESLKNNITNNCGCAHRGAWKGIGEISKTFMSRIIRNAQVREILFQVTIEYLWDLYQQQNNRCALSGLEINFAEKTTEPNEASLDRIDSSKGYVPGNVQWVHKDINLMKNYLPQDRFIELCNLIAQKSKLF